MIPMTLLEYISVEDVIRIISNSVVIYTTINYDKPPSNLSNVQCTKILKMIRRM